MANPFPPIKLPPEHVPVVDQTGAFTNPYRRWAQALESGATGSNEGPTGATGPPGPPGSGAGTISVFDLLSIPVGLGGGVTGPTGPAGPNRPVISDQSGTTYTFVLTDQQKFTNFTASGAVTATIPPHSSVAWPTGANGGTLLYFQQGGTGAVTIAAGAGVTINKISATLDTAGQYAVCQIICTDIDVWTAFGAFA